jgi:hypothetical protein
MVIDVTKNFWDLNPEFLEMQTFAELEKSLGKRRSSNVMWCIYRVFHPDSVLHKRFDTLEDRIQEAHKTSCFEFVPDYTVYETLIKEFEKISVTPGKAFLDSWAKNLKEFDEYMDSITFKSNFKNKVDGLKERPNLLEQYKKALESYKSEVERGVSENRGGYRESKGSESGQLFDW